MKRGLTIRRGADYALVSRFALDDSRLSWQAKGLLTFLMNMTAGERVYWTEVGRFASDGKGVLESARRELVAHGYLYEGPDGVVVCDTMPDVAEKRQPPKVRTSAFRQVATSADGEKAASSSDVVAEIRHRALQPDSSVLLQEATIGEESSEGSADSQLLFGDMDDEKETLFRNSLLGRLDQCLLVFRKAVDLGIDVEHYHAAILSWSNRKNRTRRTNHGWYSTVDGAMKRDAAKAQLKMVGGATGENSELLAYLNM